MANSTTILMRRGFLFYVATMLFVSGWIHCINPFFFIHSIAAYNLVDSGVAIIAAALLPAFQLVIAAFLLLGVMERITIFCTIMLYGVFLFFQTYAFLSGNPIACGCFGSGSDRITLFSLFTVATTLLVLVLLFSQLNKSRHVIPLKS